MRSCGASQIRHSSMFIQYLLEQLCKDNNKECCETAECKNRKSKVFPVGCNFVNYNICDCEKQIIRIDDINCIRFYYMCKLQRLVGVDKCLNV